MDTKPCIKCAAVDRYKDGRCKPCAIIGAKKWEMANPKRRKEKHKEWREKNSEKCAVYQKTWRKANQDRLRKYAKKKTLWLYELTVAEYEAMFAKQNGLCKICRKEKATAVDHCHETGKIRGLLCLACNKGLGFFRDNPVVLQNAIDHLKSAR